MASANPRERPLSVATTATVQSEAPPPYSEYDDFVPPPNEQTQAMLRGGYIVRQQQPDTPSMREYSPATAYMRGRPYSHRHQPNETITIARAIHPGIKADGIPFPSEYPAITSRDVTADDWSYFANCILRELEVPNVKGAIATPVTISEFRERQDMVDLTVDQWNRGFFGPRAIHIVPAYSFYRTPTAPETVRSSSPTPTYRTERTVSQDDEIMTITIDTSPRSTRAGTPDTIRELNAGDKTPPEAFTPGTLTPRTVDEELAPPRVNTPRKNSIPRKPVLPKRPSELSLSQQQTLTPESATHISVKLSKVRRNSITSVSSVSSLDSLSSLSSLDSDDDILNGDVPEIRRTLAEEFKRDPESKSHLKIALKQIRRDIAEQHRATLTATKSKRGELQAARKEHRKQMRGEMKELRKEIREYQRAHRAAGRRDRKVRKDQRKERKQIKQDFKNEAKKLEKEKKAIAKEIRKGRTPTDPVHSPTTPSPRSARHPPTGNPLAMSGPNMSMPQLSGNNRSQTSLNSPPPGANDFSYATGFRGRGQVPPRAMSTISFDGTGAAPQCSRERSPRPGGSGECLLPTRRPNSRSSNGNGNESNQCQMSFGAAAAGYGRERIGMVGRRFAAGPLRSGGIGPISMAKDFLFQQAGASLERLRLDANHGTAPRAGEEVYSATQKEGQETGVTRQ